MMTNMPKWAIWVIGGILGSCLICGGGCALLGYFGFREASKIGDEAGVFAKQASTSIFTEWKADEFLKYTEPGVYGADQASQMMSAYKTKFGQFKSIGNFSMTGINATSNNGVSTTNVNMRSSATFDKGSADVVVEVVKRQGGDWKFKKFNVD
jgi:hypothetical protein